MAETGTTGKYRSYPHHTLQETVRVAQVIRENKAGKPMRRLLLADALGIKPSSSNFRYLLSSSLKYGLTSGTEKATEIALTDLGERLTGSRPDERQKALRQAAMSPKVFGDFYREYADAKVPAPDMLAKILVSDFGVPEN